MRMHHVSCEVGIQSLKTVYKKSFFQMFQVRIILSTSMSCRKCFQKVDLMRQAWQRPRNYNCNPVNIAKNKGKRVVKSKISWDFTVTCKAGLQRNMSFFPMLKYDSRVKLRIKSIQKYSVQIVCLHLLKYVRKKSAYIIYVNDAFTNHMMPTENFIPKISVPWMKSSV
jgi:hypothetical protein